MTLNVEVCGAETLAAAAKQSQVFGFEAGTPASLADGVRYHTIAEATFGPYFTLTSVSGACTVNAFSINTDTSGTPWTNAQVTLPGSFGSYDFKIDKTVASSAVQSVYLRAETMGLVTADHEIEFVVCPSTGGNTITPSSVSFTGEVEVGATGTDANVAFTAWSIAEVITGCGVFDRYEIDGDAAVLAKLSYPEPGVTQATDCTTISDCLNIRVTNTGTHETLAFTLKLFPEFGDAVSATFTINID